MLPLSPSKKSEPYWYKPFPEVIRLMMYWQWFEPQEKPKVKKGYKATR